MSRILTIAALTASLGFPVAAVCASLSCDQPTPATRLADTLTRQADAAPAAAGNTIWDGVSTAER